MTAYVAWGLPVQVEAMYAPEIRANSDTRRLRIEAGEAR